MIDTDCTKNELSNKDVIGAAQVISFNLGLSESQVQNLIEFFRFQFIDMIRNDKEIDNIDYIADMMAIYRKLKGCERDILESKKLSSDENNHIAFQGEYNDHENYFES